MKSKMLLIMLLVCFVPILAPAQEKEKAIKPSGAPQAESSAERSNPANPAERGMSKEDMQALQADLKRMRVLVHQMQLNLAAVTSSQDPLRHQFELEIEMWQILLNQMERKVNKQ